MGCGESLLRARRLSQPVHYPFLLFIDRLSSCSSPLTKLNAAAHEIQLENLSFSYASRPTTAVLSNLNLTVAPRSITCIVGKSGAGKSTLVGVLGGLLQPTTGCVLVGGEVVVAARENDAQVRPVLMMSWDVVVILLPIRLNRLSESSRFSVPFPLRSPVSTFTH